MNRSLRSFRSGVPAAAVLAAAALTLPLAGQSGPSVVGFTSNTPLVITHDTGTCTETPCTPAGIAAPPAAMPWIGGTAYDATSRGVWVSNGMDIGKYDSRNACAVECAVMPMPNTSPNNPVTGLAYYDPAQELYVTDRGNVIRWYTVSGGCTLTLASRCLPPIPSGEILTGCATDDHTGAIFYTAVDPSGNGGTVYVAQIGAPCLPFCQFSVTTCGGNLMGPLTGIGYDDCAEEIWVTDGRYVKGISYDPINCVVLGESGCCVNTIERYIGITVLTSNEQSIGTSCTAGGCPTCPTMEHVLGSDPYPGNAGFTLDLVDAPGGSNAFVVFNIGTAGPPVLSPPFCTGLVVPLFPPPFSGTVPVGGTAGLCNGSGAFSLPIPTFPALCGTTFTSQFLGTCPSGSLFASNAVQWMIGGS